MSAKKRAAAPVGWTIRQVEEALAYDCRSVATHFGADSDSLMSLALYAYLARCSVRLLQIHRIKSGATAAPPNHVPLDLQCGLKGRDTSCFADLAKLLPLVDRELGASVALLSGHLTEQDQGRTHSLPPVLRHWTFGAMLTRRKATGWRFFQLLEWAEENLLLALEFCRAFPNVLEPDTDTAKAWDGELYCLMEELYAERIKADPTQAEELAMVNAWIDAVNHDEPGTLQPEMQFGMLHIMFRWRKHAGWNRLQLKGWLSDEIERSRQIQRDRAKIELVAARAVSLMGGRILIMPHGEFRGLLEVGFDMGAEFVVLSWGNNVVVHRRSDVEEPNLGALLTGHVRGRMKQTLDDRDGWFAHEKGFVFGWGTSSKSPADTPCEMDGLELGQVLAERLEEWDEEEDDDEAAATGVDAAAATS